jgi:hypothetical protein
MCLPPPKVESENTVSAKCLRLLKDSMFYANEWQGNVYRHL